ncbi:MAG: helix-turn-helix transcriptional regulator, partial [Ruegeria sp.]
MQDMVPAFGAECGVVSRTWLGKTAHRIAARAEGGEGRNLRPLFLSFANDALGMFNNKPKAGSVFSFKLDGKDPSEVSPILQEWMSQRLIDDILFVCLDNQGGEIDLLELHFRKDGLPNWREGVITLAPELTKIFSQRRPGLIVEAISRQTVSPLRKSLGDLLILSTENPSGLTRAEWRVCVLISRGLSAQAIGEELAVGRATVRTHLKHIY